MSEYDYQQTLIRAAQEAKVADYLRAHRHLRDNYAKYGLTEEDRDEVMAALGILTEHDAGNNHGLYVGQALSTRGLVKNQGKAVVPRKPPSRGV